jgi:hypothetical protein
MAQCAYCKAETQLYISNVPVCIECADARNPRQKRARLLQNVADATMRADAASEAFQNVIEDIPSGIPHPDGSQRIRNVSKQLLKARDEMVEANRLLDEETKGKV